MSATYSSLPISEFLVPDADIDWSDRELPVAPVVNRTVGLEANARYFSHPEWAASYFKYCHRSPAFRSRWLAATGPWDGKVVVDVGCGPGNVFATLGGTPKVLIGVDVARGGLEMARKVGYTPLLADAQAMPLRSGFADIVAVNATVHHCDNMRAVIAESARLVAPGGVLVTDHDPQRSAWHFRGPARVAWEARLTVYLWMKKGFHRSVEEQSVALDSEIHHAPGRGVTEEMYRDVLEPLGFDVEIFPHNHDLGAEVLDGNWGRSTKKFRIAQWASLRNANGRECALSLLCRARRSG